MRTHYLLFVFAILVVFKHNSSFAQLSVNATGTTYTIDFSTTVPGVSNGAYTGAGFQPNPTGGQLDSDGWATTGLSDGNLVFGGTNTAGDHARGATIVAVGTGGLYAGTMAPGNASNPSFLIQPAGSDWTPGTLTLKILNNTGSTITSFDISYNLFVRNDQERANSLNFSYSSDDIAYTNVAALDYTSIAVSDVLGYVQVGASPSRSTTISSLTIANGAYFYVRWTGDDVGGSGSVDEFALDDIKVTGFTTCLLATEPTTDASALTFSDIGCNAMTLSWANGNGANRMVVAKAGAAITGTPTDQTIYVANSNFGSGSTIIAGEYVVYKGTGNTFTIFGLSASTTYFFKVFEFNGTACEENYFTTSPAAASQATIACSQCPQLTGALINSCQGTCQEGDNELLFLNSGSYSIPVSSDDIIVKYEINSPATITYTDVLTTNAAFVNTLNTTAGCGTLFYDAMVVGTIPPNTTFIVMRNTACYGYDFSAFCTNGPIYVVFSADASWSTSGNFTNSASPCPAFRYFRTDFTNFAPGCLIDYNYDVCLLTLHADGDAISWPLGGGAANNYFNDNCSPPIAILPISLLEFAAVYEDHSVQLMWTTSSETNNDYFTVERTTDGINFENINTIEGAGNSNMVLNYRSFDVKPEHGLSYYRLKQTDFDGKFSYSELVAVQIDLLPVLKILALVPTHPELQLKLSTNNYHPVSVQITDILGKIIYNKELNNKEKYLSLHINTSLFNAGMYILHITNGNEKASRKFVLNGY